jgi:hypothetical protein
MTRAKPDEKNKEKAGLAKGKRACGSFTAALLLLYCCFAAALLLLYWQPYTA